MATTIVTKYESTGTGDAPVGADLAQGELAVNTVDGKLWTGVAAAGTPRQLVGLGADDGRWTDDGIDMWNANLGTVGIGADPEGLAQLVVDGSVLLTSSSGALWSSRITRAPAIQDDWLGGLSGAGAGPSGGVDACGFIRLQAEAEFTDSAKPTAWTFYTRAAGAPNATVESMRITSEGNVGIGTTAPAVNFAVAPGSNTGVEIEISGVQGRVTAYDRTAATYRELQLRGSEVRFDSDGGIERMRIDSVGNVGIGTAAPLNKLDVFTAFDGLSVAARLQNVSQLSANTEVGLDFRADNGTARISALRDGAGTGNTLKFSTALSGVTTERMRITSTGNVMVGTTIFPANTVSGFGYEAANTRIRVTSDINSAAIFSSQSATTGDLVSFIKVNTGVGSISCSTTATAYNTSSDYRLKENVVPLPDALDRVALLKPCRFNFIADASYKVDGFIAHEAQAVVPEAVTGKKDGEEMQGIDQSKLVPLLTAAIQELTARVEQLEAA